MSFNILSPVLLLVFNAVIFTRASSVVVVVLDQQLVYSNPNILDILNNSKTLNDLSGTSLDLQFVPLFVQNYTEIIPKLCGHLETGVAAVLDISTQAIGDLLRDFCKGFGIPYVSAFDLSYFEPPPEYSFNTTSLSVEPPGTEMLNIVASIAAREYQNSIAIVYDETFDIENIPRRLLTNVPVQHLYIKIHDNEQILKSSIENLMKINMRVVFIIAGRPKAEHFISTVLELKGTNFDPNLFVLTKDYSVGCEACKDTDNLLLVTAQTMQEGRSRFTDYMKNSSIDPDFDKGRIKVDEAFVFDLVVLFRHALSLMPGYTPIFIQDCYYETTSVTNKDQQSRDLIKTLSENSIVGVFGPMSFVPDSSSVKYNLTLQIQKLTFTNVVPSVDKLATWTLDDGLKLISNVSTLISSDKRKTYRIVTVGGLPPFVYKKESTNGSDPDQFEGYCIDLLVNIAKHMDFDYVIEAVDTIGSMDEDGNWSGAIRKLIDNEADIAVGPISVMAERENVIDFTVPYYDLVGLTILMKKPGFDYSLVKFLSVLDEKVWGCIIGAFALFSILISLFDRLSPFSYQNQRSKWNGNGVEPRIFSLKEGVWFCMMSLTPQGGGETPRAVSGRLVAATWWLFGFIIIATYTANLAAFLTVSRLETPIDSLEDLSKQFKVQYAPQEGSIASIYFDRMAYIEDRFYEIWKNMSLDDKLGQVERAKLAVWDYPVSDKYTKLRETMKKSKYPKSKDEAIQRVLEGNFAFIADATSNKYQAKINCDLWEVGEEFSRKPYALAVQEGSPLRSDLSNTILKLINLRDLEELKTKWWQQDQKDCPKLEDESDGISIRNIGGVFLVIVIGSGFSLIALAFECYWYRLRPGAKTMTTKPNGQPNQVKYPKSTSTQNKEVGDNNFNKKKENSGLDSNFVSILDAGYTNNAFEIVERL